MRRRVVGIGAGLTGVSLYAVNAPLIAMCAGVPPVLLVSLASLVSGLVFVVQWIARGEDVAAKLRVPVAVLLAGLAGHGIFRMLYWPALSMVEPVEAGLLTFCWPIAVGIGVALMSKKGLSGQHWLAAALGATGAGVVLLTTNAVEAGHIMAIGSVFVWGWYQALMEKQPGKYGGDNMAPGLLVLGVLGLWVSAMAGEAWQMSAEEFVLVGLAGSVGGIGMVFLGAAVRIGGEEMARTIYRFLPVLVFAFLVMFGVGTFSWEATTAVLLVFGGGVVVVQRSKPVRFVTMRAEGETE